MCRPPVSKYNRRLYLCCDSLSDSLSLFLSAKEGQAEGSGGSCDRWSRHTEQRNQIRPYDASEALNVHSDHDCACFLEPMLTPAVGT